MNSEATIVFLVNTSTSNLNLLYSSCFQGPLVLLLLLPSAFGRKSRLITAVTPPRKWEQVVETEARSGPIAKVESLFSI